VRTAVKILVIEDSEDDARLAMRMLRKGGFLPAYRRVDNVEALKTAFEQDRWDAVLSDFRMPGFSGMDALEVFRSTGLDIPFIFFSGTIGEETAVAAMKAGASDYVMKQDTVRLGVPLFVVHSTTIAAPSIHAGLRTTPFANPHEYWVS
jgi:DNA-binding NtrC family response regulator